MKNKKEHIDWMLAGKIVSGEASVSEQENFNIWLKEDNNHIVWQQIQNELEQADFVLTKEKIDVNQAWQKVQVKTTLKKRSLNNYFSYSAMAASVLLILGIFLFYPLIKRNNYTAVETYQTIDQIELTDGSYIDINRNSVLKYPKTFNKNERTVNLNGEAFFNVAKDKEHPFIIRTNNIKIKVLGTSFNVKDYPNISISEVIVKTGLVEVSTLSDTTNKVLLKIGEKATYNSTSKQLIKTQNNNRNFISWKTQEITFRKDKLINAITLLEEVYNVEIDHTESIDPTAEITATFEKNTIEFILNTINKSHNLNLDYTTKE